MSKKPSQPMPQLVRCIGCGKFVFETQLDLPTGKCDECIGRPVRGHLR